MLAAFHRRSRTAHVLAAATACLCAALAHAQAGAKSTSDELTLLVGAAEGLAERLAARRAETRPLPPRPAMPNFDLKGAR